MAKRILSSVFVVIGVGLVIAGIVFVLRRPPGDASFLPYLLFLAAGVVFMGAWSTAVGFIDIEFNGQNLTPRRGPVAMADGWFTIDVFRALAVTRRATGGSAPILIATAALVFGHYFFRTPPEYWDPIAFLAGAVFLFITLRVSWAALRSRATSRKVGDARLQIRPGHAPVGGMLAVRIEQSAVAVVETYGLDATLEAIRTTVHRKLMSYRSGESNTKEKTKTVLKERYAILTDARTLSPGQPMSGEGSFSIPAGLDGGGRLEFWLHVRTRLPGLDYKARFSIPAYPREVDDSRASSASAPTAP